MWRIYILILGHKQLIKSEVVPCFVWFSLRIEVVLVSVALAFLGFEIIFSFAAIFTFKRHQTMLRWCLQFFQQRVVKVKKSSTLDLELHQWLMCFSFLVAQLWIPTLGYRDGYLCVQPFAPHPLPHGWLPSNFSLQYRYHPWIDQDGQKKRGNDTN